MDDHAFEARLQRMFAEHPHYPDAPLFAVEVENRLSRGWALRRVLITSGGVIGGLIAVVQVAGARIGDRFVESVRLAQTTGRTIRTAAVQIPLPVDLLHLPFGGEVLWLIAGLAVLAGALLASRSIQEI